MAPRSRPLVEIGPAGLGLVLALVAGTVAPYRDHDRDQGQEAWPLALALALALARGP